MTKLDTLRVAAVEKYLQDETHVFDSDKRGRMAYEIVALIDTLPDPKDDDRDDSEDGHDG
jgi:hypothetical protein